MESEMRKRRLNNKFGQESQKIQLIQLMIIQNLRITRRLQRSNLTKEVSGDEL